MEDRELQFYEFTDNDTHERFVIQANGAFEAIKRAVLVARIVGDDLEPLRWELAEVEAPFTCAVYFDGHFLALNQRDEVPTVLH